jgi:UDP-N-acetylmuramate dehydrogenase
MTTFEARLRELFGHTRVHRDRALAPFTTLRVGGPADWLLTVNSAHELMALAALAAECSVPLTVLGGGSNVLVADAGVRGVVVRVHGGEVTRVAEDRVRADAGLTINGLVRWTINRGVAGLEAWAGTPGTIGGAIHGNAHFRGGMIGDLVHSVRLLTDACDVIDVPADQMEFGYDDSRLHRTREIVVSADFRVGPGERAALRAAARESLAFRKRTQPLESASAGCIFQNPDPARDRVPDGMPPSAGALVDRAGLKGTREGHARVSPTHANFIVNEGGASADDIRRLVMRCKQAVADRFGVELREEIVYLGFDERKGA